MDNFDVLSYSIIETDQDYEEAAVSRNPRVAWAKFVFTDDQPNLNNKRVPIDEFNNIIKTGVHMPIKMQEANVQGEHSLSIPIGVITNLAKQDNKVVGLAALWKEERPEDVALIQESYASKEPLKLSWELFYTDSEEEANGVEALKGTTVRGITFVGKPAYDGRTNVYEMAEQQSNEEDIHLTENETKVTELEAQIATLTERVNALTSELETKSSELTSVNSERDAAEAKAQVLSTRRNALKEAGVNLSDEDFASRQDKILGMDDDMFAFYAQELVAFSATKNTNETAVPATSQVPDVSGIDPKNPFEILRSGLIK
jgi:uncharacterized small protein (DUF1192 family)